MGSSLVVCQNCRYQPLPCSCEALNCTRAYIACNDCSGFDVYKFFRRTSQQVVGLTYHVIAKLNIPFFEQYRTQPINEEQANNPEVRMDITCKDLLGDSSPGLRYRGDHHRVLIFFFETSETESNCLFALYSYRLNVSSSEYFSNR